MWLYLEIGPLKRQAKMKSPGWALIQYEVLVTQSCLTLSSHGPTSFLCPWDSLGKNTGVDCHALLRYDGYLWNRRWSGHTEGHQRHACTKERPEDTVRSDLQAKDRGLGKNQQSTSWLWTDSLQNCKKINFSCLTHAICGIWLQQPW